MWRKVCWLRFNSLYANFEFGFVYYVSGYCLFCASLSFVVKSSLFVVIISYSVVQFKSWKFRHELFCSSGPLFVLEHKRYRQNCIQCRPWSKQHSFDVGLHFLPRFVSSVSDVWNFENFLCRSWLILPWTCQLHHFFYTNFMMMSKPANIDIQEQYSELSFVKHLHIMTAESSFFQDRLVHLNVLQEFVLGLCFITSRCTFGQITLIKWIHYISHLLRLKHS